MQRASRKSSGAERKLRGPMRGLPNGEPGLWRFRAYQSLRRCLRRVGAVGTVRTGAGVGRAAGSIMMMLLKPGRSRFAQVAPNNREARTARTLISNSLLAGKFSWDAA